MEWLQENIGAILAIIGGTYTVARLIVALTPTPKDDEALGVVTKFIKIIAAAIGLDFNQGLKAK